MILKGEAFFVDGVAYESEDKAKKALLKSRLKAAMPINGSFSNTVRAHAIDMIITNCDEVYAAMKSVMEG